MSVRPAVSALACPLLSRPAARRALVAAPLVAALLGAGAATASAQVAPLSAAGSSAPTASAPAAAPVSAPAKPAARPAPNRPAAAPAIGRHQVAPPVKTPAAVTGGGNVAATTSGGNTATTTGTSAPAGTTAPVSGAMTQNTGVDGANDATPAAASTASRSSTPTARVGYPNVPKPAPAPAATPAPAAASAADQVLAMLNQQRAANGIGPVSMDGRLINSAHIHNLVMSQDNMMSHQCPGEGSFTQRMEVMGYNWRAAAENIGWTTDTSAAGALSLQLAMYNEVPPNDGHRRNILNAGLVNVGIDVYVNAGKLWITVDFGTPR